MEPKTLWELGDLVVILAPNGVLAFALDGKILHRLSPTDAKGLRKILVENIKED